MEEVGIGALKQNASAVVAAAAAGAPVTITDRGRPVAQLSPLPSTVLERLAVSGRARPARDDIRWLTSPDDAPPLSSTLRDMRNAERR